MILEEELASTLDVITTLQDLIIKDCIDRGDSCEPYAPWLDALDQHAHDTRKDLRDIHISDETRESMSTRSEDEYFAFRDDVKGFNKSRRKAISRIIHAYLH